MADMQFFHTDQIVWLDETGCDRRDQILKHGYSLRGERPVYYCFLHRGNQISAMYTDRILATEFFYGTLNGYRFLRGYLIPEVVPLTDYHHGQYWFLTIVVCIMLEMHFKKLRYVALQRDEF